MPLTPAERQALEAIERGLIAILEGVEESLPPDRVESVRDLVAHGEPGVALEILCSSLVENGVAIPSLVAHELVRYAVAMKMERPRGLVVAETADARPVNLYCPKCGERMARGSNGEVFCVTGNMRSPRTWRARSSASTNRDSY